MSDRIATNNVKMGDVYELLKSKYDSGSAWLKYTLIAVASMAGFAFAEKTIEGNSSYSIPGFWSKNETTPLQNAPVNFPATTAFQTPTAFAALPPALPPAGAGPVTCSFVVLSSGKSKDGGLIFLNDRANFREPGVKTIAIATAQAPKWAVDPKLFKGRKVTATGRPDNYNGKEEVWVEKDSDLKVD